MTAHVPTRRPSEEMLDMADSIDAMVDRLSRIKDGPINGRVSDNIHQVAASLHIAMEQIEKAAGGARRAERRRG